MRRSLAPIVATAARRDSKPAPSPDELVVTAADFERIDVLQAILTTLNDPRASAHALARDVARFPVLEARIEIRYRSRVSGSQPVKLAEQIARLGNRELEGILLELLEDVVIVGSELAEIRRTSKAPAPAG